jgi:hypothetical protein
MGGPIFMARATPGRPVCEAKPHWLIRGLKSVHFRLSHANIRDFKDPCRETRDGYTETNGRQLGKSTDLQTGPTRSEADF